MWSHRQSRLAFFLLWMMTTTAAGACARRSASTVPNFYEVQENIDRYIASGRYEAEFANVVHDAVAYLESRAKAVTRPAIVLDIDETSLSNWPAYKVNGWARVVNGACDIQSGPCGLREWQAMAISKALKPTLELDRKAKSLGVAVFFITGRPPNLREATEKNLRDEGFEWDEVILLPPNTTFSNAADFKAPERKKITDRGYTILLTMGDQQSDLSGGYAERTFKLPNPVYFLP
jgi:predicted secreted acid phosphatase